MRGSSPLPWLLPVNGGGQWRWRLKRLLVWLLVVAAAFSRTKAAEVGSVAAAVVVVEAAALGVVAGRGSTAWWSMPQGAISLSMAVAASKQGRLATPARRSWRGGVRWLQYRHTTRRVVRLDSSMCGAARQLDVAVRTRAVDGGGVGRSYPCGSSSSRRVTLCSRLVAAGELVFSLVDNGDRQGQHTTRCVVRLNSSMLQAALSSSVAVAPEGTTDVALCRRCGSLCALNSSARSQLAGSNDRQCQHTTRCGVRLDSSTRHAILLLSMAMASEKAAFAAPRCGSGVLCVLNAAY